MRTLAELAREIVTERDAAKTAAQTAMQHALRCGELLIQAKKQCRHGQFESWAAEHTGMSKSMYTGYMRLAKRQAELSIDMPVRDALKLLAEPRETTRRPPLPRPADVAVVREQIEKASNDLTTAKVQRVALLVERQEQALDDTGPPAEPLEAVRRAAAGAFKAGYKFKELMRAIIGDVPADRRQELLECGSIPATDPIIRYRLFWTRDGEQGNWDWLWHLFDELQEIDKVAIPFDDDKVRENLDGCAELAGLAGWRGQLMEVALNKLRDELDITDEESGGPVIAATFDIREGDTSPEVGGLVIKRAYDDELTPTQKLEQEECERTREMTLKHIGNSRFAKFAEIRESSIQGYRDGTVSATLRRKIEDAAAEAERTVQLQQRLIEHLAKAGVTVEAFAEQHQLDAGVCTNFRAGRWLHTGDLDDIEDALSA
jgi:hypothetical protein